jgi:hypothetical protein
MRGLRIYATPDGESHFGDVDIAMAMAPLFPNEASFELSGHYPASRIRFVHIPAGVREAGGTYPRGGCSQCGSTVLLSSRPVTEKCVAFRPAALCWWRTHGKGHVSRHPLEGQSLILITLPDGLDPP